MAKFLWLNWSGGGNLPPSLGIARALTERGHAVAFTGRPEMMSRVERAGFRAIELTRAYEQAGRYPNRWLPKAASFLTSPAVAEEIEALLKAEHPDALLIDAMFPAALIEAQRFPGPTAVMLHSCLYRMLNAWRQMMELLVGMRAEAGFGAWPADLGQLWMSRDRVIVTTLAALDPPQAGLAHRERVVHVGPVLERERHMQGAALPWPESDPTPLVLVSFSTMPEQGSVAKFQRAIDALAALPVHAAVTTGDSIDPAQLAPATNVVVFANADHDALMRRATMVVTHGGHGTFMRALRAGLPMVIMSGLASDQPVNAGATEAWGIGRAVAPDASVEIIRAAIAEVLSTPSFAAAAQALSRHFEGIDGAAGAADAIEALVADHRSASPAAA